MPASLLFHLAPPDLQEERCINARHRQAGCTLCVEHCPTAAISLLPGPRPLPVLDADACVGCGICIPVCPTDAFTQGMQPETRLVNLRTELPGDEAVLLVCPQHPAPARSSAPARVAIRHQRCLAAFSPEQLLELSHHGSRQVWLADETCARCPLAPSQARLNHLAQAVNTLLAGFGIGPAIHLVSHHASPAHELQVLDAAAPEVTRRGFFRSLGGLARQRVDEAVAHRPKPLFAPGAPVDARLPYQQPHSLQRLNQHLDHLARQKAPASDFQLATDHLPWAQVNLDAGKCSGCQLCARFCPTGALSWRQGEQEGRQLFNLDFHPALCLDCNICVAVCPHDALDLTQQLPLSDLLARQPALLLADYLEPCQRCGALTRNISPSEPTLCYACQPPTLYRQRTQRAHMATLARQLARQHEQAPSDTT